MRQLSRALAVALWVCAVAAAARGEPLFRIGPVVLDKVPPNTGNELGKLSLDDALKGRWPDEVVRRVRAELEGGGRYVLLVGRTDTFGPKALNRSLGLQYAVEAGRKLAAALPADLSRFGCASLGEEGGGEPGISVLAWAGPEARPVESGRVTILEPAGVNASAGRFWSFWERGGGPVVWGLGGPQGTVLWDLAPLSSPLTLPLPAYSTEAALGIVYAEGGPIEAKVAHPVLPPDRNLPLRLEPLESWAVRVMGKVPGGYSSPVVWVCGIPYPAAVGPDGQFVVDAAIVGRDGRAFLQAVDPVGRAAVGAAVIVPEGEGVAPDLVAVLVWDGRETDLDLVAWSGPRRTDPQDPDAAVSSRAVPGARLLFDGDGSRPASALVVRGSEALDLEVHCYSDLGAEGTTAWLYVAYHPGDALRQRGRILGPRRLSGRSVEMRWPALSWKGE